MRVPLEIGLAPNDHKGDPARVLAIKVEDALTELYLALSGNRSEVELQEAIPVNAGGTGAKTAVEALKSFGLYRSINGDVVFGAGGVRVTDTYVMTDQSKKQLSFRKEGTGVYKLAGTTGYNSLGGFKVVLPKDILGNLLLGAEVVHNSALEEFTITVYAVVYEEGRAVLDTNTPMDIPNGLGIDINVA